MGEFKRRWVWYASLGSVHHCRSHYHRFHLLPAPCLPPCFPSSSSFLTSCLLIRYTFSNFSLHLLLLLLLIINWVCKLNWKLGGHIVALLLLLMLMLSRLLLFFLSFFFLYNFFCPYFFIVVLILNKTKKNLMGISSR